MEKNRKLTKLKDDWLSGVRDYDPVDTLNLPLVVRVFLVGDFNDRVNRIASTHFFFDFHRRHRNCIHLFLHISLDFASI